MRLALPQPFEDIGHVADVGVRVRGATAEEALARLVLAFGALVAGDGLAAPEREERVAVAGAGDPLSSAMALLRELLFRFATERRFPCACEVARVDGAGAEATVAFARWDPRLNDSGEDVKAVTWHAARLEPAGDGWVGQVVFDV